MSSDAVNTVRDFVSLVRGTTYKGDLVGKPGPALLGLGSIQPGGGFREADFKTYGGDCPEKLMLAPGDLFASLKGATKDGKMIGSVARVPASVASGRLTQDTVKLQFFQPKREIENYLYWVLRTPQYRDYCAGRAMGSAVVAMSREDFLSYEVPPLTSFRSATVELLEEIEKRERLLRETNATLEGIALALFKSWFVDFDPVRTKMEGRAPEGVDEATAELFPDSFEETELGLVPRGWRSGCLGDVAKTFKKGVVPSNLHAGVNYIGLEHIPRKSLTLTEWGDAAELESNKATFNKGDILFGKLRPYFHKVVVAPTSGVCSTDILVCQPTQAEHRGLATMHLFSDSLISYADRLSNGAKMPRVNWSDLAKFPITVPSIEISSAYTDAIEPLLSRMNQNTHAARTLASVRDTLLPRLISGQLRLPEAEARLEEHLA